MMRCRVRRAAENPHKSPNSCASKRFLHCSNVTSYLVMRAGMGTMTALLVASLSHSREGWQVTASTYKRVRMCIDDTPATKLTQLQHPFAMSILMTRFAAMTTARRIAHEMGVELGGPVGYHVRYDKCTSSCTVIKVRPGGGSNACEETDVSRVFIY